MKKRNLFAKKMQLFYEDIEEKRPKNKKMRLQTDLEFQQNKIKRLNSKYNVEMFSSKTRGRKAFAAEQKIRDLKKLLLRSGNNAKRNKVRLQPVKLIQKATINLNRTPTQKYGLETEQVESKSLKNKDFKEVFDFYRLLKVRKDIERRDRFNEVRNNSKNRRLRDPLKIGEKVLVLAERIKKKMPLAFYIKAQPKTGHFLTEKKYLL